MLGIVKEIVGNLFIVTVLNAQLKLVAPENPRK